MEEELKKAYETLGLPADATREQVENRYFILMKRERSQHQRASENEGGDTQTPPDLSEYTKAYRLILGLESEKASTEPKQGKVGHFFYYYKIHLIVGIVILLIAGYTVKESIDKRNEEKRLGPVDLSVSVMGNFYFADADLLQERMLALEPDWNRIKTTVTFIPPEIKSEQDMALQQKGILTIMTEKDEIYFLDQKNFDSLAKQEAFKKLDELPGWSSLRVPQDRLVSSATEDDPTLVAYGVDVTDNPLFKDVEMTGERVIMAIRAEEEEWPKTMDLASKILQSKLK